VLRAPNGAIPTKRSAEWVSNFKLLQSTLRIAVGTVIADRPPHRSVRAQLRHMARHPEQIDTDMVQERGEFLRFPFLDCLPYALERL
jgi:hypothetical protein